MVVPKEEQELYSREVKERREGREIGERRRERGERGRERGERRRERGERRGMESR